MNNTLAELKVRGFYSQCTDIDSLSSRMDSGPITFYVGCDPTGPSLHIGHMVPFFALRHLRSAGKCRYRAHRRRDCAYRGSERQNGNA